MAEDQARREGWENLGEKEYYSNLERYEDLSFSVNQVGAAVGTVRGSQSSEDSGQEGGRSEVVAREAQSAVGQKRIASEMPLNEGYKQQKL